MSTKTFIIVVAVFVAMAVFGIISRNKNAAYAKEMKHYTEVVIPAARAYGDSMKTVAELNKARADSALEVANVQSAEIHKLKTNVAVLRGKNQSLVDAALSDTNTPPAARAAIEGLQQEVAEQHVIIVKYEILDSTQKIVIANLTTAYGQQKSRADSLDVILSNVPKPPGPVTVIGIKMPHIPAWVGYTAVAVGGYYIGTQVNK